MRPDPPPLHPDRDRPAPRSVPVGITMGCPVGIGPEIILKYLHSTAAELAAPPVVIGDAAVLAATGTALGLALPLHLWHPGEPTVPNRLNLLNVSHLDPTALIPGRPTRETGAAMAVAIDTGISLCLAGHLAALVTCPISKAALNLAGYRFPGHTEMLAARTGAKQVAMMLAGDRLRVVLATIHCPFRDVVSLLNHQALVDLVRLTDRALRSDFGLRTPRIGVAGLNPHGGEEAMFGREEIDIIAPAVQQCRELGLDISGPHPPDTIFYQAAAGRFDVVVCMYHDQGLIPFKLLHFADGVNVTLGLPIVRTSVDHGTAYDIAGRGSADFRSLQSAVTCAVHCAANRHGGNRSGTEPSQH